MKAFWWLSGITIAYFVVYYLLIVETKVCEDVAIQNHWFHGFWDRYLGCRSVNELGDALAGAFAPIAFLWLAGAVFIQSKELEAQREELNETQEVMRQQLEVAKQQVKETEASTTLFRQQTSILEKEQKQRDEKQADEEFDQRLENLMITLAQLGGVSLLAWGYLVPQSKTDPTNETLLELANGEEFELLTRDPLQLRSDEIPHIMHLVARNIDRVMLSHDAYQTKFEITHWNLERLTKLRELLRKVTNDSRGLSAKYHLKLDGLGVNHLAMKIDELKPALTHKTEGFKRDHPSDYLLE
ncbi:hypothetical protein J5N58_16690 [Rhizobium cremeum]|uniref:hypothetical protein n=1 Tax=Rhizobium cremeum TaxID=2813827 RepID=UPI001FD0C249|nr:hypothetical protein [Rhizobium cremeum]MCJ7996057.1 hypothetical protein [Rhizobium cremeum]MCJ8001316.1 hypothetical protein [Rhizobium cremeum]